MVKKIDIKFIKEEYKKIQNFFLKGDFEKVIEKTKILIKKDSSQTTFYNLIGLSYKQLENYKMAEKTFKSGLKVKPNSPSILCNLGSLYRNWGKFDEAKENFERALEINPNDVNVLTNYANLKRDLNKIDDSLELYQKAFNLNENHETLLINYAGAYQIAGEFEKSKNILKLLHKKFPNNIIAHKMYSSIHTYQENDEHQKIMLEKINNPNLNKNDEITLLFSIAKSFSDQKNPEKSAEFFTKANDAKFLSFNKYNFNSEIRLFNKIKKMFENYEFDKKITNTEPELIFIVGLPRSGTTLMHQIISSHSKVFGGGELPILRSEFLTEIENNDFTKTILENNNDFRENLRNEILNKFKYYDQNLIILDKAPLNFFWIGFIKILFPSAKIIHSKRNLKDTALSIYKNVFDAASLTWAYDQECLVQFIEYYKQMMKFWHNKLPGFIYDCEYEKLVKNKDNEIKELIKFCNLDWEENCMDHTQNKTAIKTVSISQAREPIYQSSVNLNELYIKNLKFLAQIKD